MIYRQELRRRTSPERSYRQLETDRRNVVPVAFDCHGGHHSGARRLPMHVLPGAVFEFARELMGAAAYDYLAARYSGGDPRHDALLSG